MEIDQLPTDVHPHPNPLPHPHHRKIELQSPLDLIYLRENIASTARQKLDLHFPPDATTAVKTGEKDSKQELGTDGAEKEDPMRTRVAALVTQFLDRTFDYAGHSISVNGNDVATSSSTRSSSFPNTIANSTSHAALPTTTKTTTTTASASTCTIKSQPQQEPEREGIHFSYEPYDPRLSTKLASLYADLERETLAVSQLRRTAPAEGAKAGGEALLRSIEEDQQRDDEAKERHAGEGSGGLKLEPLPGGWSEEVAEMYERGLGDLRRLGGGVGSVGAGGALRSGGEGGSLTETVGKVQRARDVAMEFD
jgi:Kinetochore protein Mis14 like